jgi:hypothetical protein
MSAPRKKKKKKKKLMSAQWFITIKNTLQKLLLEEFFK